MYFRRQIVCLGAGHFLFKIFGVQNNTKSFQLLQPNMNINIDKFHNWVGIHIRFENSVEYCYSNNGKIKWQSDGQY